MRRALAFGIVTLAWGLGGPALAGPIRVGVETETPVAGPFLVRVSGHYADFHNGRSRHWKTALIPAGGRHFVALGPVNALLNMGVSVSIYHPAYVSERERSHKTPLLIRPVGFETFRPRTWRAVMASQGKFANGGPEQFLGQALGHLQAFVEGYLPALDASDAELPDAVLRAHLPLFREIERFAASDEAALRRTSWAERKYQSDPDFARGLARRDLETRADLREWLRRSEAWLSVPRAQRVVVRQRVAQMRYAKSVGEELLTDTDLAELAAFVERHAQDRAAGREPEGSTSWTNGETRVSYRVSLSGVPRSCTSLSVTTDLTTLVDVDLGDLTNTVKGKLCRGASGSWEYGPS